MAPDPELSELHRDMEASEAEVSVYRGKLADRLATDGSRRGWAPWPWALGAAALLLVLTVPVFESEPGLPHGDIDELQLLLEERGWDEAYRLARRALAEGSAPERRNARMILVLGDARGELIDLAHHGLLDEPRPEFRAVYLEYLLDHADERYWDAAHLERLMDRETDHLCYDLFRQLLKLSRV